MQGKTVVVTGATSGIGAVAADRLAQKGARIVFIARDRERGQETLKHLQAIAGHDNHAVHYADLMKLSEQKRVAQAIADSEPRVDVLINNAGALFNTRQETEDGLEKTFALNHMSYFTVTNVLLDKLKATPGARIVSTSSDAHKGAKLDFSDLQSQKRFSGFGVYGKSKIISFGQSDWRSKRAIAGGGILLDQGIHMVDLMRLFGGEFPQVHSFISNAFWHHDVEDNAYALMQGTGGVVAMLHSSATQWRHRFNLDISLERGSITLSGILSGSKSYGAETLTVAWADTGDSGDPREQTTRYNNDPSWADEIAEFADSIRSGKVVDNGSSTDALRTMELVYRIYCADPEWKTRWALTDEVPHVG